MEEMNGGDGAAPQNTKLLRLAVKKTWAALGSKINDSTGSGYSDFAKKQMEKFGWTEGKGLGKKEDGITKHIKVQKKEENSGIGLESTVVEETAEHWWHDSFSGALSKLSKKKKSKKSKQEDSAPPTFEELYAATGGARLGMRARMAQKGKISRAEKLSATSSQGSISPVTAQSSSDATQKDAVNEVESSESDEKIQNDILNEVESRESDEKSKKSRKSEKKSKKRKRESE